MSLRKFDFWKLFNTVIIGLFSLCFLIPLLWMTSAAMKYEKDVMVFPIQWIPQAWNALGNFKAVWAGNVPFHLFYFNSIKLSVIVTALTLIISSMAAFSFTKLNFRGRNIAFTLLLTFMIVPEQATLIPRFLLIRWLGLYDTHLALILMMMFSIYFTFLLRQFMMSIHSDFIEAAKIDGAGYFRIYWQIMLPLCKPILATVAIIKFIWTWNDYQMPLISCWTKSFIRLRSVFSSSRTIMRTTSRCS